MSAKKSKTFKIVIVGKSAVGKTSILRRFTDDRFSEDYLSTIGVDFKFRTVKINQEQIKLQIWDTAGSEKYKTITKTFYKGAEAVIIVFDITDKNSFDEIFSQWVPEIQSICDKNLEITIIGNKIDLPNEYQINPVQIKEICDQNNIQLDFVSAKTGENIDRIFVKLTERIQQQKLNNNYQVDENAELKFSDKQEAKLNYKNQKGCCS